MRLPSRFEYRFPKGFKPPRLKDLVADMKSLGEEIAEAFKEEVTRNIENNKFGYRNAPGTIQRKKSGVPLIDTHEMVDNIVREGTTVTVADTPHEGTQLTNKELAIVQEYGTKDRHVPARPVWRRTFEEFRGKAAKRIKYFPKNPRFKK